MVNVVVLQDFNYIGHSIAPNDEYGKEFAERLRVGCRMHGHIFKCYTTSVDKEYDYEVIVY